MTYDDDQMQHVFVAFEHTVKLRESSPRYGATRTFKPVKWNLFPFLHIPPKLHWHSPLIVVSPMLLQVHLIGFNDISKWLLTFSPYS